MIIEFENSGKRFKADLSKPLDISIPLVPNENGVNCFYAPPIKAEPVRAGDFIGSIEEGGILNFKNLQINPHGNGTHTESVAHISLKGKSINKTIDRHHFLGKLISVEPRMRGGDKVLIKKDIEKLCSEWPELVIIRTQPNGPEKLSKNYSGTNPPYCDPECLIYLREKGVRHLMLDLPSVDREDDGGKLLAHKAFWNVPHKNGNKNTITELVYVPDAIKDGWYLVNMQTLPLEMDASPSRIVLFAVEEF